MEGLNSKRKEITRGKDAALQKVDTPMKEVKAFLRKYESAKIVVIIDTHCLENGRFVWTGDSPTTYQACDLHSVSYSVSHKIQLANTHEDFKGLHSKRSLQVHLRCRRHSETQA